MRPVTVFEFGTLKRARLPDEADDGRGIQPPIDRGKPNSNGEAGISEAAYKWLEDRLADDDDEKAPRWIRRKQRGKGLQVTNYVGVIRTPDGTQIEVLPKIGKALPEKEARKLLLQMLACLREFRNIPTANAELLSKRMPLLEVFISEFLRTVADVTRRGLRSDYLHRQDNLPALRGKLLMSAHLRHNLVRRDRFYTEHDEFSQERPENRLIHAALVRALAWAHSHENQRKARELHFAFADIPPSSDVAGDFKRVRLDRGMKHYRTALAWARLILRDESPLTGSGRHDAPSLLFPMERLFEAYVAKHLREQLKQGWSLESQVKEKYLVQQGKKNLFQLRPDLLIKDDENNIKMVLDTKWKLVESNDAGKKYSLSEGDFYQLLAYGQNYLNSDGKLALIYPKTDSFKDPLDAFDFNPPKDGSALRLWVLPFCLESKKLVCDDVELPGIDQQEPQAQVR